MTARVLVVDDIVANVRLLEAKLSAEYFDVVTAMNGLDALEAVQRTKPDIILLDVMMPGIDGIEVCKRIKANPATQHIPIVMVTALDQPEDRIRGLEAGADDFLTKPVNDISLFCRIKSLVRLKMLTDELRLRSGSDASIGLIVRASDGSGDGTGRVLVLDGRPSSSDRIRQIIATRHQVEVFANPQDLITRLNAPDPAFDLVVVSIDEEYYDALRLCSQLRSIESSRQVPILIVIDPDDQTRLLKALDLGVNDYLMRPVDRQELLARVSTQVRRWRYTEQLRSSVRATIELAVTDSLTGLYNRRYLESHLNHLVDVSANHGKALSVIAFDIDFFKIINDTFGHDVGDRVLQELATRIKQLTRNIDISCRIGGEEFVLAMPNTDIAAAERIAERLRRSIATKPFEEVSGKNINVTISAGVATLSGAEDTVERLLKRADMALYQAKREGRNRVIQQAA